MTLPEWITFNPKELGNSVGCAIMATFVTLNYAYGHYLVVVWLISYCLWKIT